MRSAHLASSVQALLLSFRPAFGEPSFENFVAFIVGWVVNRGPATVSRALVSARALGLLVNRHHSSFYRFLSRARWSVDDLGRVLLRMLLVFLPERIVVIVDDTLSHRRGAQIFGAGMHHDTAKSTYGGAAGRRDAFSFGHSWVFLSVFVPFPWNEGRGIAVPLLFRLYRPRRRCPEDRYRARTVLAREMIATFVAWLPAGRSVHVLGDREYACQTVVRDLPEQVRFTGSMPLDAALYEPQIRRRKGPGRPRVRGLRAPGPQAMAQSDSVRWEQVSALLYGAQVTLLVKTWVACWATVAGPRPLRIVLTRDPKGVLKDRAFFTTETTAGAGEVLERFARRWTLEVTFQAAKGALGLEGPRNGWWRRPAGRRRPRFDRGPRARGDRGHQAVERTLPLIGIAYGVVVAWYLQHGRPAADVTQVRRRQEWYRQKREPCFNDMLASIRRTLWSQRIFSGAVRGTARQKLRLTLRLLAAAA